MVNGDEIEGILLAKRLGVSTKFSKEKGDAALAYIELVEDFAGKADTRKGSKHVPQKFPKGTVVTLWMKAGLKPLMDVPEQAEVCITCTGYKDVGKGQPMTLFEIQYNEPETLPAKAAVIA